MEVLGSLLEPPPSGYMTSTVHFPSSRTRAISSRRSSIRTARRSWTGARASFTMTARTTISRSSRKTISRMGKASSTSPSRSLGWGCSWTMTAFPSHSAPSRKPERAADSQAPGGKDPPGFRDGISWSARMPACPPPRTGSLTTSGSAGGGAQLHHDPVNQEPPGFPAGIRFRDNRLASLAGDEREYDITKLDDVAVRPDLLQGTVDQEDITFPGKNGRRPLSRG